jgi:thiamine-monophosphate kinase
VVATQANAMIDVSDGLSTDLRHVLEESRVSARIYKNLLPRAAETTDSHVLHGGEEYELLIVAPDLPPEVESVRVTRIGEIIEAGLDPQLYLIDGSSETILHPQGYQHWGAADPL